MSDNKKVNKLLGEVSKKYGISKEQLESCLLYTSDAADE